MRKLADLVFFGSSIQQTYDEDSVVFYLSHHSGPLDDVNKHKQTFYGPGYVFVPKVMAE